MKIYIISIILLLVSCTKEKIFEPEEEKRIVGIQPYEKFSQEDAKLISFVIDSFYRLETKILPNKSLPKSALRKLNHLVIEQIVSLKFKTKTFQKTYIIFWD